MSVSTQQANFMLPADLLMELRRNIPKGKQSKVVSEAIRKELKRIEFKSALKECFGAWSKGSHPELREGAGRYIRKLRHSSRGRKRDG